MAYATGGLVKGSKNALTVQLQSDCTALNKGLKDLDAVIAKLRRAYPKITRCKRCFRDEHWGYCWYNSMWITIRKL
jgi:hypothetical protein